MVLFHPKNKHIFNLEEKTPQKNDVSGFYKWLEQKGTTTVEMLRHSVQEEKHDRQDSGRNLGRRGGGGGARRGGGGDRVFLRRRPLRSPSESVGAIGSDR